MVLFAVLLAVAWRAERRMQALALWGIGFALAGVGIPQVLGSGAGARWCGGRGGAHGYTARRLGGRRVPIGSAAADPAVPYSAPSPLSVLRNIEQRISGLFEGVFGRTFRSTVQPVELARKLAKEMDDHKTISIHRVYVPDEYTVFLNPADREQFAAYETQMRNELAEYLVEHARREGYRTATRPLVLLETDHDLTVGMFGIAVGRRRRRQQPKSAPEPSATVPPSPRCRRRPPVPEPAAPVLPPIPAEAVAGATMIYAPGADDAEPRARAGAGAAPREHAMLIWDGRDVPLDRDVVVIGRSSDCDVVVDDPNVSRRHAEVRRIGDGYSLVDLGSTNGTEVNGQRIQETALMNGDVIGVGTTRITFERRLG